MVGQAAPERISLAWQERSSLNPLETFDFSGEAAMRLVYRGLFMLDDAEMLRTDLAEEAIWSPDHYELSITLRKDVSFSNGDPLTSRDAALSILYRRYYLQLKLQEESIPQEIRGTEGEAEYYLPLPLPWEFLDLNSDPLPEELPSTWEENPEEAPLVEEEWTYDPEDEENFPGVDRQIFTVDMQADYLNQLASDTMGLQSYAAIESIKIIDQYSFKIILSERAERLPWYLCFPVIPEKYVENHDLSAIPGIGEYKFTKSRGERGDSWELNPVSSTLRGPRLYLQAYPNFDQALADFNQDKLDLLLVPPKEYLPLRHRQGLQASSGQSLTYQLILAGSDLNFPLADPQLFRAFREAQILSSHNLPAQSYLNFPHRASDWRQPYTMAARPADRELPDLSLARRRLTDQTLTLAAVSNSYNRSLLAEIKQMFFLSSSKLEVVWLKPEELASFAAAGHYDLLLLEVELSLPTDLRTLAFELNQLVPSLNLKLPDLSAEGLLPPAYFYAWDLEMQDIPLQAIESSYWALSFALERSRVLGLGFAEQALLFGPRLVSNLAAPPWDPYRYLKEVQLWP